jgi:hypothetical protein
MDNCPSHVTDDVIHLLTEARVCVVTFTPHTIQIFQVLDVTLFDVLKRRTRYELSFEDEKERPKFIMKVYHDFKQTMVEFNIWGTFQDVTRTLWHIPFYSMRKSSDEAQASESSGRLTSSWINSRVSGKTPDLTGSTGQSKMICSKRMSLSLVRCRDIVLCQKPEKWNYRETHHITSTGLWVSEFFI